VTELIAGLIDVFADTPLTGNPLAVVLGGEQFEDATLKRLAGEFNQAETTFILPSRRADHRLRSFTASGAEVFEPDIMRWAHGCGWRKRTCSAHWLDRVAFCRRSAAMYSPSNWSGLRDVSMEGCDRLRCLSPWVDRAALETALGLDAGAVMNDPRHALLIQGQRILWCDCTTRRRSMQRARMRIACWRC
jgi:hypothetical protein